MKYKIAYIDEDRSWINIFYHVFKHDFEIIKIHVNSTTSITTILDRLKEDSLHAIVTDYLLVESGEVEFNGNIIVEEVRRARPHFPIVMLTSHASQAISHTDDVHIIYSKDILSADNDRGKEELEIFKAKISSNISNYYRKIEDTNNKIEELVEKRNSVGLEPSEEEDLTKLYILFDELNPDGKSLPTHLIQRDSIYKLDEFLKETKEILEQLKRDS